MSRLIRLDRSGHTTLAEWTAEDAEAPAGDRVAHLLLALREDEEGFVTVANLNFSGAVWRCRRRIGERQRPALDAARGIALSMPVE